MNTTDLTRSRHGFLRLSVFVITSVLIFSVRYSNAQASYRFQNYGVEEGLAKDAYDIVQDSLGFIWILHETGLSRFDGYNFKFYKHDPDDSLSLPGSHSKGHLSRIPKSLLQVDPAGNLWVISEMNNTFTMATYDRMTDGFVKYYPGINVDFLNLLCFEKDRPIVWFNQKGLSGFNLETGEKYHYVNMGKDSIVDFTEGTPFEQRNAIFTIADRGNSLLLATWSGLWEFDKRMYEFRRPLCDPADSTLLYHANFVHGFAENSTSGSDELWLVNFLNAPPAYYSLIKVNKELDNVRHYLLPDIAALSNIAGDHDGVIWISTWGSGLFRLNPKDSTLTSISKMPGEPYALPSSRLHLVAVDRHQNVWVTSESGLSKFLRGSIDYVNYAAETVATPVFAVYHAAMKDYLAVVQYHPQNYTRSRILSTPIVRSNLHSVNFQEVADHEVGSLSFNSVWRGKDKFWLGSLTGGFASLPIDSESGKIPPEPLKVFLHDPENPNTITCNKTTSLWEDGGNNLWVSTHGGGLNMVDLDIPYGAEGSVVHYEHNKQDSTTISSNVVFGNFYPEGEHTFWISTAAGLDLFDDGKFQHVFDSKFPTSVLRTTDGKLLVGGSDGLYEGVKNGQQYDFIKLPVNYRVCALQEDHDGRLWISNCEKLICYDPHLQTAIEFSERDGIGYTGDQLFQTSQGLMVTSDRQGVTIFDPLSLRIDSTRTQPVLTNLAVNNHFPNIAGRADGADFVIETDITVMDELVLDHEHNNFAIAFSSMHFAAPEKNLYRHKLEGYDENWIETDWQNRLATYTNLEAGKYTFRVMASNHQGIWSDQEATLIVHILPPPWKTWWAFCFYGMALVGIVLAWRSYDIKRVRLKHRAEHLDELDHLKSSFFANISHEFRTPITLILGPLKDLYTKIQDPEHKRVLASVQKNGQRLLRLINQLLDLSKVEVGKMKLQVSTVDLVQFLRNVAASYESLARDKMIRYFFYPEVQELMMYIDEEKMEKVVHNILSNAFKFTPEGGEIILNLRVREKLALIAMSDTGIGIPADQLDKIFDRFFQVDSSKTRRYEGSGLGLALVKDLVELHHGKVSVDSREGKGTTFTISLPLGKDRLQKEEIVERPELERTQVPSVDFVSSNGGVGREKESAKTQEAMIESCVVLIVEDNADMRQYIRKTLSSHYQIIEAENGREAVSKAQETMPDLIISDIMMPEMNGYKLCNLIKTNELTSHIPVILLTAKADRESKLSGLEIGADDYLSKPFDVEELKLIVRNRIEERCKMREHFSKEITLEPRHIAVTPMDEKFIINALHLIEVNMDNEDFSIEAFSQEAGYSKMNFYRKIKALTGQTPSQFVRSIRLKRAAQLLLAKSDKVTQIAYSVGFSSLAYFNKCFKEQFGVTPGEYAKVSQPGVKP